jgi:hypothetical protein
MTRRIAFAFALLASLVVHDTVSACDCPVPPDPARALAQADAVFEGEVVSIGPSAFAGQPCGGLCPDTDVRFRVARAWKGSPPREVVVQIDRDSDCAFPFAVGSSYVVYASRVDANGPYYTDNCRRTRRSDRAAEDLRVLGAGTRVR